MSEAGPMRGIVLTHGDMAFGLVDAVRKIAGPPAEALVPLSNEGQSREGVGRALEEAIGTGPAVIFTDMRAGSCSVAARLACSEAGRRVVIFGVNLPMLLDFVFHQDLALEELIPRLLQKGREAVGCMPEPAHADSAPARR